MTTRTIRNGATITVPVETGETLKIVAVTGTYTATIVRGTGIGTALATAATGGSYGPYAYAIVVSIAASASSEIDFDVAVTPDVASDTVPSLSFDTSGNVTGLVGPGGNAVTDLLFRGRPTMALLGDSITLRNQQAPGVWNCEGYFVVANMLMGQKYNIVNVSGFSGYTIEQIAASGLSGIMSSGARSCFVLAGTNNVADSDATTIYNKLVTLLWTPLAKRGIAVVVATIPPNAGWTAAQSAKMALVNEMIRASGYVVCDLWRATVSSTTGAPKSGVFGDGIHPSANGAMYFAREIAAVLSDGVYPNAIASGGWLDPKILSANPLANGNNANGVNGFVLGVGGTGTGPDQWTVKTSNAGTTFTSSGNGSRNPADYVDGKTLDVALTFRSVDDDYFSVGLFNGADIYLDRAWAATTAKVAGTLVRPTAGRSGLQYKCITSGTTGGSQPTWPTDVGSTVTDGSCVWMAIKDMAAGDLYQLEIELTFSALSGQIALWMKTNFEDGAYSGVLRPSLVANGVSVASAEANAISPAFNLGTAGFDNVPLNKVITVRSQVHVVPSNGTVVHVAPEFRLYGKASATATFKVQRFEYRRLSA